MTNAKWEEIILVAPRTKVFEAETLTFQGTETDPEKVARIVRNIAGTFSTMRRGNEQDSTPKENNAEINTDYKQPIPYAVIRRGEEIYMYERLSGGGEGRLHNKLSLGAGGHMNPIAENISFGETLSVNLSRELEEELDIEDKKMKLTPIGLINDDSEEVSKVHIGVLTMIDVAVGTEVSVRETEQLDGSWILIEDLKNPEVYNRLETWSQIVVDLL